MNYKNLFWSFCISLLCSTPSIGQELLRWANQLPNHRLDSEIPQMSRDNQGHIYYTAYGTTLVQNGLEPRAFLRKMRESTGELLWEYNFDSSIVVLSHCVDSAGDIYLTGYCQNQVDFSLGNHTPVYRQAATAWSSTFIAKYRASDAQLLWVELLDIRQSWFVSILLNRLTWHPDGYVLLSGAFSGTANFGTQGQAQVRQTSSVNIANTYVAAYSPQGQYLWVSIFGGGGSNHITDVKVDFSGNIVLTGLFVHSIDINPGAGTNILQSGGNSAYIVKLSSQGFLTWGFSIDSLNSNSFMLVQPDRQGNIWLAGCLSSNASDFDPSPGNSVLLQRTGQGGHLFLARYRANGSLEFAHKLGSNQNGATSEERWEDLAIGSQNELLALGRYSGGFVLDLRFNRNNVNTLPLGRSGIFLVRYDDQRNYLGHQHFTAVQSTQIDIPTRRLLSHPTRQIWTLGMHFNSNDIDFDPNPDPAASYYMNPSSSESYAFAQYSACGDELPLLEADSSWFCNSGDSISLRFTTSRGDCPLCEHSFYSFQSQQPLVSFRGEDSSFVWTSSGNYYNRLGGCPQMSAPLELRDFQSPSLIAFPSDSACAGDEVLWQLNGLLEGDYRWSDSSSGQFYRSLAPSIAELSFRDSTSSCLVILRDSVAVRQQAPDASFATASGQRQFCHNLSTDIELLPLHPGGQFVGPVINGYFLASQLNLGDYPVRYELQDSFGCSYSYEDTLSILSSIQPNSHLPSLSTVCRNQSNYSIQGQPSAGQWTVQAQSSSWQQQMADPLIIQGAQWAAGERLDLVYSYTDSSGCSGIWQGELEIAANPQLAVIPLSPRYCSGAAPIPLQAQPSGGQWQSSQASSPNLDTFNNLFIPAVAGSELLTYTYTDPQTACSSTYSATVDVLASPLQLSWQQVPPSSACRTGDSLSLLVHPAPQPGEQVQFRSSWPGALLQQQQNQSIWSFEQVPDSIHRITVEYSYLSAQGCEQLVREEIELHPRPQTTIRLGNAGQSLCEYYAPEALELLSNGNPIAASALQSLQVQGLQGQAGQWLWGGLAAGAYPLCLNYIDSFSCLQEFCDSLYILDNPEPLLSGLRPRYCHRSVPDTLIALPLGGQWSGSSALQIASTGNYAVFSPSAASQGTVQIIYTATHANACQNSISETTEVQAAPQIQWQQPLPNSSWCNTANELPLEVHVNGQTNPLGGQFFERNFISGQLEAQHAGIVQGQRFSPALLGNRELAYIFTDPLSACSDTSFVQVQVQQAPQAEVQSLDSSYCLDNSPDTLALQLIVSTGLQSWHYSLASGRTLQQFGQAEAVITPLSLGVGADTLFVDILDNNGCSSRIERPFSIGNFPSNVQILNAEPSYCANSGLRVIQAQPSGASSRFYLYDSLNSLIDSSLGNSWLLNSQLYQAGGYSLEYSFADAFGCRAKDTAAFHLHPRPQALYEQDGFCQGDTVILRSRSIASSPLPQDSIDKQYWYYQGQFMGMSQHLVLDSESSDWGIAELIVETVAGCRDTLSSNTGGDTIRIYSRPNIHLQSLGACQGDSLLVWSDSLALWPSIRGEQHDYIQSLHWNWGDGQQSSTQVLHLPQLSAQHQYNQPGAYTLRVEANIAGHCASIDSLRLHISPTVRLQQGDYEEHYALSPGSLLSEEVPSQSLWKWGALLGRNIEANHTVWALRQGLPYQGGDTARLYMPCLDLQPNDRPFVELEWTADLQDFDGLALEYFDEATGLWKPLGQQDRGLNWYNNDRPLFGLFQIQDLSTGTQLQGFTGRAWQGWQNSRYALDEYAGQGSLRLRLSFGSLASVPNTDGLEGFAIRKLALRQRKRQALLELMSNSYAPQMRAMQDAAYQVSAGPWSGDMVLCQYPGNASGPDALYEPIANESNARRWYYGAEDKDFFLNGSYVSDDFADWSQAILDAYILQDADFAIELSPLRVLNGELQYKATLRALRDLPQEEYRVQALLVEDSTLGDGYWQHRIVHRFLPDHAGNYYNQSFTQGDSIVLEFSLPLSAAEQDPQLWFNRLAVVFVQRERDKQVLQAAQSRQMRWQLASSTELAESEEQSALELLPYPNPSTGFLQVRGIEQLSGIDYSWQLWSLDGRLQQQGQYLEQGLWLGEHLSEGMYILRLLIPEHNELLQWQIIHRKP